MNSRLMPRNSRARDLIWLFLTLETPTQEVYVLTVPFTEEMC